MDTLRAVLVGCGSMSRGWLKAITAIEGLTLVGLVDIVEDVARARKDEFGLTHAYTGDDLAGMLAVTRPDIVFDVTVPEAHAPTTLTALRHGCHVLGEKPMATSMEDARQMVAAAQRAGKLYAVMQNRRYTAPIRRVREFLRSGAIGPLTTVNCDFYIGAHFGGFRDHMPHVLLVDMAIHTFDQARFLTGLDAVRVAFCKEWNPRGSWYDRDASAIAVFEMNDHVVFTYRGSWCAEGMNTSWESDWRFVGANGSATWDGGSGFRAQTPGEPGGLIYKQRDLALPEIDTAGLSEGHASAIRQFVRCIREGEIPETVCTDNIKSLAMVFGAIEAAASGRPVTIQI
ncbi:MAG: Gfo/Idh/MocA family oxidoreductase [Thermoflexales bacterium]|nr:Gfo/Idh/MocA family oxidoreductase [Thermoflexales bacterium]MDW8352310.1 Gfo/Idh/MocA family oxidoreductase [Anaerolineae bacterium]